MRRLRYVMLWVNGLILVVTAVLQFTGNSPAIWLYDCGRGIAALPNRVIIAYYLLFWVIPAVNFITLATNKERPVQPKHLVKLHPDNPL